MTNDLMTIETVNLPVAFANGAIDPLLEQIEQSARAVALDISTPQGRKDIASLAYKIAQSKTLLDKTGDELATEWREKTKKINAERKRVWDRLEALQKEIRAPLTEWEDAEKNRVAGHEAALLEMVQTTIFPDDTKPDEIERRIARLIEIGKSRNWEEFTARANDAHCQHYDNLMAKLEIRKNWERDQAELERLRAAEQERQRIEREELLKTEAAAKAKAAAEAVAKAEADALAAKVKAEQEAAAQREETARREKAEAEERAKKAEEARIAAEAKAEADRLAAEEKARQDAIAAAEKAKREAELAAQREREKIEAERKAEADAQAKREADKAHRGKINLEAARAIMDVITFDYVDDSRKQEALAKSIVTAIAKGEIPHVRINY